MADQPAETSKPEETQKVEAATPGGTIPGKEEVQKVVSDLAVETKTSLDSAVKQVVSSVSEGLSHTAKDFVGSPAVTSLVDEVGTKINKLISDPWASLKGLASHGSPKPENEDKDAGASVPPVVADMAAKVAEVSAAVSTARETEEPALPTSDKNVGESSGESPPAAATVAASSSADDDKSEVPRSTENQPLMGGSTPGTRTSWMTCCGLLELLKSSDK